MTTEQAFNNLYSAARLAPLTADQHDVLKQSAEVLVNALKPKETSDTSSNVTSITST
jgi:hypothetical protein